MLEICHAICWGQIHVVGELWTLWQNYTKEEGGMFVTAKLTNSQAFYFQGNFLEPMGLGTPPLIWTTCFLRLRFSACS